MPRRSTLSDANAMRPQDVFESAYRDLYATYKGELSSDSRKRQVPKWKGRLQIIDSTIITPRVHRRERQDVHVPGGTDGVQGTA